MYVSIKLRDVARLCHEVNAAFCRSIGDNSQPAWEETREDIRESALIGVCLHLTNPMTPEQSHQAWMDHKLAQGWKFGETKDLDAKTHPSLIPFADLHPGIRAKDVLFKQVVESMSRFIGANDMAEAAAMVAKPAAVVAATEPAAEQGGIANEPSAEPLSHTPEPAAEPTTDSADPAPEAQPVAESAAAE